MLYKFLVTGSIFGVESRINKVKGVNTKEALKTLAKKMFDSHHYDDTELLTLEVYTIKNNNFNDVTETFRCFINDFLSEYDNEEELRLQKELEEKELAEYKRLKAKFEK